MLIFQEKRYQGISRTGQKLCPAPALIDVRVHQIFTSFKIKVHWFTRVSFRLFSFHCWGKLGKSSMLPDTSSSPDVPPCTPIMVKPSRLKTMHDNSPTDSSTINHYFCHISDEVGQLCTTTPVLDNVASHSQCFWSACQPSPPLPPPLLDQSSCCVDLQEAPDTVQVKGWQLIPWQKTPMARQKREKKAGPVLLLCGFAGGTWYPANQGLTKLATINSVTIG